MQATTYRTIERTTGNVLSSGTLSNGTRGGDLNQAAEYLANRFRIRVTPSGRPVFVDEKGRDILVYLAVHPAFTPQGQEALRLDQERREAEERQRVAETSAQWETLHALVARVGLSAVLERLSDEKL